MRITGNLLVCPTEDISKYTLPKMKYSVQNLLIDSAEVTLK